MFDMGFMELMVIGVLALLVLGPERLPQAARTVGLILGKVRRSVSNFQEDLERQARTDELRAKLRDPASTLLKDEFSDPERDDSPEARQGLARSVKAIEETPAEPSDTKDVSK